MTTETSPSATGRGTGGDGEPLTSPGACLRRARRRSGLSLAELASRSGVSKQTVHRIETDSAVPRRTTRVRLAVALETTPDSVFPLDRPLPPPPSAIVWPPAPDPIVDAVQAYRAAGDSTGAGELLGIHSDGIRKRLNAAGARPRPRGGSNAQGIESLAAWARKLGVPIETAIEAANQGRVPGAFVEELECSVIGVRWAVRPEERR